MTTSDWIAIASLFMSTVTASAALYLAIVALRHSARPRCRVRLLGGGDRLVAGEPFSMSFEVENVGHWFGAPPATDIKLFPNYPPGFTLLRARSGSALQYAETQVEAGKDRQTYIKIKHIMLPRKGSREAFTIEGRAPEKEGDYVIRVDGISAEGGEWHEAVAVTVARAPGLTDSEAAT